MPSVGTVLLVDDRYRLDARIAVSDSGEIWRGTDLVLARPVAVKLLRADYAADGTILDRFRAAAQRAGTVAHENIARIYDYDESDVAHPPFLIMELVDGPSLAEVLLTAHPLEPARVLDLVAQAAAGLAAAHRSGLVHRDIRPGNLLLAGGDVVKITNFGISRAMGDEPVTAVGLLAGASAYLSPERVTGSSGTAASDLYSLGIVGYECLAGSAPYSGTELEVALAHQHSPLPPLPADVPEAVVTLIRELTAKDPARRPGAGQVAARARELRDSLLPVKSLPPVEQGGQAATGVTALGDDRPSALQPDPFGQTRLDEVPAAASAGPRPGVTPPRAPRRGRPPYGWRVVVGAAAAVAVVLALILTGVIGHGAGRAPAADRVPGADGARFVKVNDAALRGQPVDAVRRQLRQLGLVVRVRWRASDQVSPGRVLSVAPAGRVPAGSVVVITGAIQPTGTGLSPGEPGRHSTPRGDRPGHHKSQAPGPGQSPPSISVTPTASPTATSSPSATPSPTQSAVTPPSPSPSVTASPPGGGGTASPPTAP
jgi:hypothetical protein